MATNNTSNNTDQLAANSIRGNNTGSPALGLDLTVAQTKTLLDITTGQIGGTATNDSAAAGKVGEFASQVVAFGSAVAISASTPTDQSSLSLTAGDWDVWISVFFSAGTAGGACYAGISQTTATLPDNSLLGQGTISISGTTASAYVKQRVSLASTTTVYCVAFVTSNANMCGGIYARRVR